MDAKDVAVARKLKSRLSALTPVLDFRVFGSRARGNADEYSDLDVFVEVEALDHKLKEEILETAWEVGFEHLVVISVLVFTRDEIENSPLRASPIVRNIFEQGVMV